MTPEDVWRTARSDIGAVSKDDLVWACAELGLPKGGNKEELLVRLTAEFKARGRGASGGAGRGGGGGRGVSGAGTSDSDSGEGPAARGWVGATCDNALALSIVCRVFRVVSESQT